jgi:tripartite-type tricarboxylate transporter receptor subunit TctC
VPALVARVPYDTVNDFVGIAVAGFSPHVLVSNPRTPATTVAELIALLRANPGKFNFASAGIGSGVHLAGEIFRGISAAQFELVHYRGGGPGVAALVSGEAQFGTPTMASCLGQVRGGGVLARLAVALPATLRGEGCGPVHLARLPCGAVEVRRGDDARRLRARGVRMLPWGSEEVAT